MKRETNKKLLRAVGGKLPGVCGDRFAIGFSAFLTVPDKNNLRTIKKSEWGGETDGGKPRTRLV